MNALAAAFANPAFWFGLLGLAGGAGLLFRLQRETARADRGARAMATARAKLDEVERVRSERDAAREDAASLRQGLAASEARLAEREAALAETRVRLDAEFRSAASKMLNEAHTAFLARADETFARHRETETAADAQRRQAMEALIGPMRETLTRYEKSLSEMRLESKKASGELSGRIGDLAKSANDVRAEAQKLSSALRAGPKVRGRWGEEQLRNVVELAGMTAHVDFV
ncbi:MAG: DNA recombination protein RmuC, partial [Pseudomonadota bacterium]